MQNRSQELVDFRRFSLNKALEGMFPPRNDIVKTGRPGLVAWGLISLFLHFLMFFSPPELVSRFRVEVLLNSYLWCFFAYISGAAIIRFSFPITVLLVLQVWSVIVQLVMGAYLARPLDHGIHLWWPIEYGSVFFVVHALRQLLPRIGESIVNVFLVFATISAVLSLLQFLGLGPALSLAKHYSYADLRSWGGIRSTGLMPFTSANAFVCTAGICLLAIKWASRPYKWSDSILLGVFSLATWFAQSRVSLPAFLLAITVVGYSLLRHNRKVFLAHFWLLLGLLPVMVPAASSRLAYIFQSQYFGGSSFLTRVHQINEVGGAFSSFPLTGVGPDGVILALGIQPLDKWGTTRVESLYFQILFCYGIPGLGILVVLLGGSLLLSWMVVRTSRDDPLRKALGLAAVVISAETIIQGISATFLSTYVTAQFPLIIAAMITPTEYLVKPAATVRQYWRLRPNLKSNTIGQRQNG